MTLGLHLGMFINTLENLGTDEQRKKWIPLTESLQILGTQRFLKKRLLRPD